MMYTHVTKILQFLSLGINLLRVTGDHKFVLVISNRDGIPTFVSEATLAVLFYLNRSGGALRRVCSFKIDIEGKTPGACIAPSSPRFNLNLDIPG